MRDAPFFAGRIEGIRAWSLSDDLELRGRGIGSSEAWAADGAPTQAVCLDSNHRAPRSGCECGLYALHPQARISEWVESFMTEGVAGVVEAWGRIELHEVGFRAEFARPKLLFEPAGHLISSKGSPASMPSLAATGCPWSRCRAQSMQASGVGPGRSALRRRSSSRPCFGASALRLRRTSRVSLDRRWLRVGVWPEVVGSPSCSPEEAYTRVHDLPGVRICTVRVRGPEAIAAFESEEFDPGRRLQLVARPPGTTRAWRCARNPVGSGSAPWPGRPPGRSGRVSRRAGSQRSGR